MSQTSNTSNNKFKDILQGIPEKDLWEAFRSTEVFAVFREEFGKRWSLYEFLYNEGLHQTGDMLAEILEWRAMLRAAQEAPKGGAE
jgi:hypothetical protein